MSAFKRKESRAGQFDKGEMDEDIKAELEAMTNLEYNLHDDLEIMVKEYSEVTPAVETPWKKCRAAPGGGNATRTESARIAESRQQTPRNTEKTSTLLENENLSQASTEELRLLMRRAAVTCEDKYRILEARDRLMRAKLPKARESARGATEGTCPDMCPEKERLMRESRRQAASYELADSPDYRMDHAAAIKQYSRSSADQEEPLPQDLRPVGSLEMTMSYLLREIADLSEDDTSANLAEWYHFLWDRTRGIRKDVTQQELCCPRSVRLVEQCARFHIVCAERLCAEETSVFDDKINTENLTKCLQTLKYMYHDLRLQGIVCENEAEFRGYVVLLNLNNANFMWEVARLPEEVQKSPEMRFALDIHSCLDSNNYAKFFRLVGRTTYLNACILLRYFDQARARALSVMVKAYCRTSSTAFPLSRLIDILAFEDENEAISFCERLGLGLSDDELRVVLDRRTLCIPSGNFAQRRARKRVEAKRTRSGRSIGLCIAGERMPDKLYENHRPHDSFDSEGYLKPEAFDAKDQRANGANDERLGPDTADSDSSPSFETSEETSARSAESVSVVTSPPSARVATFDNSVTSDQTIQRFTENAEKVTTAVTGFSFSGAATAAMAATLSHGSSSLPTEQRASSSRFRETSGSIFGGASRLPNIFVTARDESSEVSSIFAGKAYSSFRSGASTTVTSDKTEKVAPRTSAFVSSRDDASIKSEEEPVFPAKKLREEPIRIEPEAKRSLESVETTLRIERETDKLYARLEKETIEDICNSILEEERDHLELVDDTSEAILEEILEECVERECEGILDREFRLDRAIHRLTRLTRNRIIFKYYGIWRDFAIRKRRQRVALEQTPVWLQRTSVEECARSLYRDEQRLAIENMRRKRFKANDERPLTVRRPESLELKIYEGIRENARILETNLAPIVYWKMLVSWPPHTPEERARGTLERCRRTINRYVCPSTRARTYRANSCETLRLCVVDSSETATEKHGAKEEDASVLTLGSDALLFVTNTLEDPECALRRLTATISSRRKLMPLPVVALVLVDRDERTPKGKLEHRLDRLVTTGYVSEYVVRYEENLEETVILGLIENATYWLALNKSPAVPLEMDYSRKIVDTCLTEEFWLRILGDSSFNEHLRDALRDINFVISLHNEAVAHLTDILLDPESLSYTDFPSEFREFLPKGSDDLPRTYENFDSAWRERETRDRLERQMNELLLPEWRFGWPISDPIELDKCLARYCRRVSRDVSLDLDYVKSAPIDRTNFIETLLEIAKVKIGCMEAGSTVVYNKNHVRHFRNSPWWLKSSSLTTHRVRHQQRGVAPTTDQRAETTVAFPPSSVYTCREINMEIQETIERYEKSVGQTPTPNRTASFPLSLEREVRKRTTELRRASDRLEKTLAEQKYRSRLLEDKLSLALAESADH